MSGHHPPEPPPPAERRPTRRRRTLLAARVSYNDGATVFDCMIRDLSLSGARISLSRDVPLPTQIYLINIKDQLAYQSIVVWNKKGQAGVHFLKTLRLGELNDPALAYLKRLWLDRAAR